MSFEPFLDLTLFSFLPAHFPEKDPRQWAEEEGQEETAVHQTIFQPSLRLLRAQTKHHRVIQISYNRGKTSLARWDFKEKVAQISSRWKHQGARL